MNEVKLEQIQKIDRIMHKAYSRFRSINFEIEALFPNGITSTELSVIKIVNSEPDIVLKEISEKLSLPGSTLTSAIDRLEQRNLLKRVVSKKNRRSYGLELSEEGKKINAIHEEKEKLIWIKVLSALDNEEEREIFMNLFEKILKTF